MNQEQALALAFPEGVAVERKSLFLDEKTVDGIKKSAKSKIESRLVNYYGAHEINSRAHRSFLVGVLGDEHAALFFEDEAHSDVGPGVLLGVGSEIHGSPHLSVHVGSKPRASADDGDCDFGSDPLAHLCAFSKWDKVRFYFHRFLFGSVE